MQMRGRLEELERLGPWLQTLAPLGDLDETTFQGVQLALYELCANIIEHGQHDWPPSDVTLWWVPTRHHFLIVDQGRPFAPPPWKPTDYGDARVRRRGRGHGLDIVRRLAAVHFHPSSPVGNVTRLDLRIRGIHPHQEEIAS